MKILVTGADGFVGSWLVPRLVGDGHQVVAAVRSGAVVLGRPWPAGVDEVTWDIADAGSVRALVDRPMDVVVHLAAVASGQDAFADPALAWSVNAVGTARLAELVAARRQPASAVTLLLASTAEVYGPGQGRRREADPVTPASPYAASKVGAEVALLEVARRTGLRAVIARAFAHTGARQDTRFVIPALARRIVQARQRGEGTIPVGNMTPVRDILHVRDVVDAYVRLLARGRSGEVYNVASGSGATLADVFSRMATLAGWSGTTRESPDLLRPTDIAHLVGDASKLTAATGWRPTTSLDDTLTEVLRAQAD